MFDGPEVDRAGEGIIDHGYESVGLCEFDNRFMVRYLQHRIRHRLDIDCLCVGPSFLFPRLRVVAIDEIIGYTERVEILRDKIVGPAVEAILDKQVIPNMEECE